MVAGPVTAELVGDRVILTQCPSNMNKTRMIDWFYKLVPGIMIYSYLFFLSFCSPSIDAMIVFVKL